jgi:hypothetical protein
MSLKAGWLRPRFSLWALLVLITVIAIPLSYVGQRRSWNLRRKLVSSLLAELGSCFDSISFASGQ